MTRVISTATAVPFEIIYFVLFVSLCSHRFALPFSPFLLLFFSVTLRAPCRVPPPLDGREREGTQRTRQRKENRSSKDINSMSTVAVPFHKIK